MSSNYSHDHIALDPMNIMANGQYIDRIMTKIQNLTSRQATLSVNSAIVDLEEFDDFSNPRILSLPAYFYSLVIRFLQFFITLTLIFDVSRCILIKLISPN